MKSKSIALFLPVLFVFSGCAASKFPELSGWQSIASKENIDLRKAHSTGSPKLKAARLLYIDKKQSEFAQIMGVINEKLEDLRSLADKRSALHLLTGGSGIASGIAATALTVASAYLH